MAKPYSLRLEPLGEWVLVRKDATTGAPHGASIKAPKLLVASKDDSGSLQVSEGPVVKSRAIVVAVGPGEEQQDGRWLKPDPRLKPGVTILANAQHFMQFSDVPEMKDENLYFIPAGMICFVVIPAGVPAHVVSA